MTRALFGLALACGLALPACTKRDDRRAVRGPVAPAEQCPRFGAPRAVGVVTDAEIVEASGLAASARHPGALWTHNDSGDRARVFALRASGETAAEIQLEGVSADDFEDIAVGPCEGSTCVFVADIGDNGRWRREVAVHRFREPELLAGATVSVHTVRFRYADGAHDAETLLVDPLDGQPFVITKEKTGPSALFRVPLRGGVAQREATFAPPLGSNRFTSGSIAPGRSAIALRTYTHVYVYAIRRGEPLAEALTRPPCVVPTPPEAQGEAIAFTAEGTLRFVGEGARVPLYEVAPAP